MSAFWAIALSHAAILPGKFKLTSPHCGANRFLVAGTPRRLIGLDTCTPRMMQMGASNGPPNHAVTRIQLVKAAARSTTKSGEGKAMGRILPRGCPPHPDPANPSRSFAAAFNLRNHPNRFKDPKIAVGQPRHIAIGLVGEMRSRPTAKGRAFVGAGQGRAASFCAQRLRLLDASPRGISGTQSWGARLEQAAPHGVQELTACQATAPAMSLTNRWTRSLPGRQGTWPMRCIGQGHWSCQDDGRIIDLNLDHPQKPRDRSVIFPWCQPPRRTLGWDGMARGQIGKRLR